MFTVGLNRAVTLLAEKRAGGGKGRFGRATQRTVLKDLGEHPSEGGKIEVLDGKYGAYVTHNKVNATVPKAKKPEDLTVDEAVALLAERIANGGGKKGAKRGKAAAKPKPAKTTKAASAPKTLKAAPAKKPAAKIAAPKSAAKAKA